MGEQNRSITITIDGCCEVDLEERTEYVGVTVSV